MGFFSCLFVSFNPGWNYLLQSFWLLKSGDKKLNWSTCKTEVLMWEQQITVLTQIMQTRSFNACKRHTEILHFIYIYITVLYLACHIEHWFSAAVSKCKIDRTAESFHDNFSSLVIPVPSHKQDAFILLLTPNISRNYSGAVWQQR